MKAFIKVNIVTTIGDQKWESEFETTTPSEITEQQVSGVQKYALGCHVLDCATVSPLKILMNQVDTPVAVA